MKSYTVSEISNMLKTSPETVRRWIREGKLKASRTSRKGGNSVLESDLTQFLDTMPKYASIATSSLAGESVAASASISALFVKWLNSQKQKSDELDPGNQVTVALDEMMVSLNSQISMHNKSIAVIKETLAELEEELESEEQEVDSLEEIIEEINTYTEISN